MEASNPGALVEYGRRLEEVRSQVAASRRSLLEAKLNNNRVLAQRTLPGSLVTCSNPFAGDGRNPAVTLKAPYVDSAVDKLVKSFAWDVINNAQPPRPAIAGSPAVNATDGLVSPASRGYPAGRRRCCQWMCPSVCKGCRLHGQRCRPAGSLLTPAEPLLTPCACVQFYTCTPGATTDDGRVCPPSGQLLDFHYLLGQGFMQARELEGVGGAGQAGVQVQLAKRRRRATAPASPCAGLPNPRLRPINSRPLNSLPLIICVCIF